MVTSWMCFPLCHLGSLLPFQQLVDLAGPDLAHPGGVAGTGVRSIRLVYGSGGLHSQQRNVCSS